MENIVIYRSMERTIAHTDEVERALGDHAFDIAERAKAKLARHRKTGEHRITQTKGTVDHFVNLVGEAAVSVEEGHHDPRTGEFVEGIHVLKESIL